MAFTFFNELGSEPFGYTDTPIDIPFQWMDVPCGRNLDTPSETRILNSLHEERTLNSLSEDRSLDTPSDDRNLDTGSCG